MSNRFAPVNTYGITEFAGRSNLARFSTLLRRTNVYYTPSKGRDDAYPANNLAIKYQGGHVRHYKGRRDGLHQQQRLRTLFELPVREERNRKRGISIFSRAGWKLLHDAIREDPAKAIAALDYAVAENR